MEKLFLPALLGCVLSGLTACSSTAPSLNQAYEQAVIDAIFLREKDVSTNLLVINDKNPALVWNAEKSKILVVTWKGQAFYEKFLKPNHASSSNPDHVTWVTTAPQVQEFCQDYLKQNPQADKQQLELRLKQYLGLNAARNYDVFVEMWVSPGDLFRPCVDPEINDPQCNLQFGKNQPQVKNIPDYVGFYKNLYFKSFRESDAVPWTGLGYTYDWGNEQSPVGASEFILAPQSAYKIERVIPTQDYCKANH